MEQKQGVKKETRRHYIGYFLNGEYHIERLTGLEIYEYDSNGYVFRQKSENYDINGEISYGTITTRRHERGEYIFERYNLDGKLLGHDRYNAKWQLVESRFNQLQRWSYDHDDNMIEEYGEYSGGWWKIQYEYNIDGKVVKSTGIDQDGKVKVIHHYYSCDCMGNTVESIITEDGEFLESNVFDRLSDKLILNKDERIEEEWTTILRLFKNGTQVSCSSWYSDDIVKSSHIKQFGSWLDDWNISIEPSLHENESEIEVKGSKCWITIRNLECNAFDDGFQFGFDDF